MSKNSDVECLFVPNANSVFCIYAALNSNLLTDHRRDRLKKPILPFFRPNTCTLLAISG